MALEGAVWLVNPGKVQQKQQHNVGAYFEMQVLLPMGNPGFITSFLADRYIGGTDDFFRAA